MASTTLTDQEQQQKQPLPQPLLNLPLHHRASLAPHLPSHSPDFLPSSPPQIPLSSSPPRSRPSSSSPQSASPLPHLTLTYATSLDSALSLSPGVQTALSGPTTKAMTHYLRLHHDAILVGANTAIVDDPGLNCRHVSDGADVDGQTNQPVPVILDPSARWEPRAESTVLRLAREGKGRGVLWIVCAASVDAESGRRVRESDGEVVCLGGGLRSADGGGGVGWKVVLEALAERGIRSVMVEGGAKVIMDLLKGRNQRWVKSVVITVAPVWLGEGSVVVRPKREEESKEGEAGRLKDVRWVPMGEDVVLVGRFGDRGR